MNFALLRSSGAACEAHAILASHTPQLSGLPKSSVANFSHSVIYVALHCAIGFVSVIAQRLSNRAMFLLQACASWMHECTCKKPETICEGASYVNGVSDGKTFGMKFLLYLGQSLKCMTYAGQGWVEEEIYTIMKHKVKDDQKHPPYNGYQRFQLVCTECPLKAALQMAMTYLSHFTPSFVNLSVHKHPLSLSSLVSHVSIPHLTSCFIVATKLIFVVSGFFPEFCDVLINFPNLHGDIFMTCDIAFHALQFYFEGIWTLRVIFSLCGKRITKSRSGQEC